MSSVLAPLYAWGDRAPDRLLYAWLDIEGTVTGRYTYAGFLARTADIAVHLRGRVARGDRVLLAYPPGLEVICAFFACLRLGAVPVPVYPPTQRGFGEALARMGFIARDCDAAAVLTDRAYFWSMKVNRVRHRIASWSWSTDAAAALPWIVTTDAPRTGEAFADTPGDLAFLQYTSGSTSDPKGVMVSHANLWANADAVVDHLPVGVSWLPQYHDMGLIGYYLFFAMKGGTTYGFSPVDFIRRPALWLETISRFRGTASSAPNFAYAYCLRPGKLPPETYDGLDLSSLRFLMTAAEPVRPDVYRRFLATFAPYGLSARSFFSAYGLAENTLAVTNHGRTVRRFDRSALARREVRPTSDRGVELVSCGAPLDGVRVRIVDPDTGTRLADGRVGEVWVAGTSVGGGYWGRAALSEATFRARQPDGSTWLRTGDLGFLDRGELFLAGRIKDVIIVRGQNHHPHDIEQLVEADPSVRPGCVAAFGVERDGEERVVVVAEARGADLPDVRGMQARVQRRLGLAIDTLALIPKGTIPKTSSGKLARHAVRARYAAGDLQVVHTIRPGSAPEGAVEAPAAGVATVLGAFGLTGRETCTVTEAGLDSLQLVELVDALKAHLDGVGEAALAQAVDHQVLQSVAVCELSALLDDLASAAPHARLRFSRALARLGREHRAREQALLRRDARLSFDPGHLPRVTALTGHRTGTVLLTGATGFFGPFLLASLLRQTDDRVIAVVRGPDPDAARRRVLAGVREAGIALGRRHVDRVEVVCGDLSQVNLGLTTSRWDRLAVDVDAILHNGAWVNYLYDYATLRDTNVGGTNEVVRLAMSHRPKVLDLVSTTFVFGWSVKDTLYEHDSNDDLDLLDFGYSQSKWVAEQVVRDAMAHGLQARIFRPALITPSVAGDGSHFDIAVRLLAFMLNHGLGTTAANQVSFSPADVTASNIVAITRDRESLGGTFHVTRDAYASMQDVTALLGAFAGVGFTHLPLDAFVPAVIARCRPGDILYPLLEFFVRSTHNITAMEFKRYDNARYRHFRDRSPHGVPDPPLADVVRGLLRFMRRKGIVADEEVRC